MKDYKQTDYPEDTVVGEDLPRVTPSKEVILMFRGNARYELRIGRNYIIFNGREKKKVSSKIIEHPDFTPSIAKRFSVQEVI